MALQIPKSSTALISWWRSLQTGFPFPWQPQHNGQIAIPQGSLITGLSWPCKMGMDWVQDSADRPPFSHVRIWLYQDGIKLAHNKCQKNVCFTFSGKPKLGFPTTTAQSLTPGVCWEIPPCQQGWVLHQSNTGQPTLNCQHLSCLELCQTTI